MVKFEVKGTLMGVDIRYYENDNEVLITRHPTGWVTIDYAKIDNDEYEIDYEHLFGTDERLVLRRKSNDWKKMGSKQMLPIVEKINDIVRRGNEYCGSICGTQNTANELRIER